MKDKYDVIIVGAGPAGIFAALELTAKSKASVLIIDKGSALEKRNCRTQGEYGHCLRCEPCAITCGWGGAGAFSDGKLTLTSSFGGVLDEYIDQEAVDTLIDEVDQVYLSYGASHKVYGTDFEAVKDMERNAAAAGLNLIPAKIRHLGTENCYRVLEKMHKVLLDRIDILMHKTVEELICDGKKISGVRLAAGEIYNADYVICGPGRIGAEWMHRESKRLGLKGVNNPVDIGVRVEVPAVIMENLTRQIYESKLVYFTKQFDDRIRTFCMNPYGVVVTENNEGLVTVNGHSFAESRTNNTNFALLVSKSFTEPFNEPIRYGRYIASLANMLGDGVIVQRLGDLLMGRRSTPERIKRGLVRPTLKEATPGDLSLVLPYRYLLAIIEMLEALDKLAPGVNSRHTLLYGVEVKFYSYRLCLNNKLETAITNLFAVGDGAGVTRGLIQASATGIIAAREILSRLP
ncbi:MAG: NAD(P)/FAD-dependent oxidoreductase [Dethiobacteria bacterium]|nr:NAD(P)/FAD-dependent oxidoreductase [Dethiobacteria bacterium]